MAKPEHLKILKQGVEVWNKWREDNPDIEPNLSRADLSGMDLIEANFHKVNLWMVNLKQANLSKAKITNSEIKHANLNRVVLVNADLSDSWFGDSDLSESDLSGARLMNTSLRDVNLQHAIIDSAYMFKSNLNGADLRNAKISKTAFGSVNLDRTDLSDTDLRGNSFGYARFMYANLKGADLRECHLSHTILSAVKLTGAKLNGAKLNWAFMIQSELIGADLTGADLSDVNLNNSDLSKANLTGANLKRASLVEVNLKGANLSRSRVYGISVWNPVLDEKTTKQDDLIITKEHESIITVDNLEVAQFIYLLLKNEKIRSVIDTIGEKGVLILGRFTEDRKVVLDAIRGKLRELDFVPMMFDFEKPTHRDFTETIKTLAGMSRFIIADITNPKSSPLELQATMPDYMIPFVPIIQEDEEPFAMFQDLQQKYGDWVLDVLRYDSADNLLKVMDIAVVRPALKKADELFMKKAEGIRDRHVKDYM